VLQEWCSPTVVPCRYMLGSSNSAQGGTEDQAAATTAVTEALAAIHVVQAYNLQVGCGSSAGLQHAGGVCSTV
jgi:hypothetical protein